MSEVLLLSSYHLELLYLVSEGLIRKPPPHGGEGKEVEAFTEPQNY